MLKRIKKSKKPLIIVALAIAAIFIAYLIITLGDNSTAEGVEAEITSYQVQTSNITNTVEGTGNLALDEAEDISIPTGIVIEEVLVEKGDYIAEGDTLMTLDMDSVSAKIAEIQESITSLDEKIEDVKDDSESTSIRAGVSGRVKKIYTSEGEAVAGRISESGSLMLLSVDGLMAVDILSNSLSTGNSVTVTLSDGTTKTGTVESASGGSCTITLTDNGPVMGDEVTITDGDGNTLGSGLLYIHSEITIIATSGTVSSVSVSENQSVSSGTTLLKLDDVSASSEYISLMSERKSLVESLQEMVALGQTGEIRAQFSGTVSAVNVSDGDTTSSSTSSSASSSTSDSSASSSSSSNGLGAYGVSYQSTGGTSMTLLSSTAVPASDMSLSETDAEGGSKEIVSTVSGFLITAPVAGVAAQTDIGGNSLPYTGKITWSPALESGNTFAYNTAYKATVYLTPMDGYEFSRTPSVNMGSTTAEGVTVYGNGVLTFNVSYAATASAPAAPSDAATPSVESTPSGGNIYSGGSSGYSGTSGSMSAASGISSAASSDSTASDTGTVTVDEVAVISIAPDENLIIEVSIDELDIMSLAVDQVAAITLDAVENEVFTGTITKVNTASTSSGGVSTYSVTVSVPKTDSMLAGMSASVSITIEEESGVLIIPVDAVQEMMGNVFVYTQQDENGELSGQVNIETGISNGLFVRVVSGLSEGDTVYYRVSASDEAWPSDFGSFTFGGMGGGMGGMERSAMPDGGAPPNMDGGGQMRPSGY